MERGTHPARHGGPAAPRNRGSAPRRAALGPRAPFHEGSENARRPINARAETVATSGMFWGALASRRRLVPADAFYEWKAMADGKQPYAIARTDGAPLAFAGLWEGWRSPDGETLRTFDIITTSANADMAGLHDRMPVVLEAAAWPVWLGEAGGSRRVCCGPQQMAWCGFGQSVGRWTAFGTMGPNFCIGLTFRARRRLVARRKCTPYTMRKAVQLAQRSNHWESEPCRQKTHSREYWPTTLQMLRQRSVWRLALENTLPSWSIAGAQVLSIGY